MVDGRDAGAAPSSRVYGRAVVCLEALSAHEHNVMIFQPFSAI
jgi:hypothetical protein